MRLLLDTHVLIWWALDHPELGQAGRALLSKPDHQVFFSSISLWEIAIKSGKGALSIDPIELRAGSLAAGLLELPFSGHHACRVATLPPVHRDPFDRALVAQAAIESMTLVSRDEMIAGYPVGVQRI